MNAAPEENPSYRPCLILAHRDPLYAAVAGRCFRQLGWDVYGAGTGPEARRLARMLEADWVVLDTDLPEESGWLICDKLLREQTPIKVILVATDPEPRDAERAAFIGASALVDARDGPAVLLQHVCAPVPSG
jgi:CheY-like chemotaxis protein